MPQVSLTTTAFATSRRCSFSSGAASCKILYLNWLWCLVLAIGLLCPAATWAQDSVQTASGPTEKATPVTEQDAAQRVEQAYLVLGRISGGARRGADTNDLAEELPEVEANLKTIRQNLTQYRKVINLKQVRMFQILLTDMQEQLGGWRTELATQGKRLTQMQFQLDSLAAHAIPAPADTTTALGRSTQRLKRKQQRARQLLARNHQAVTQLQTRVSDGYIQALELQDEVREQSRRFTRRTLEPANLPLWQTATPDADAPPAAAGQLVRESYASQQRLLRYYFTTNWHFGAWMLVVGLVFFAWVFRNFRLVSQAAAAPSPEEQPFRYLRPVPIAGTLVVVFSVAPFFDLNPPAAYTDLLELLLLVSLSVLLARSWARRHFWYWLGVVGLFLGLTFVYAASEPGTGMRWAMFLLNLAAVGLGVALQRQLRNGGLKLAAFVPPVVVLFIVLNALAAVCNFTGRVSIAKVFSSSAILGLTQIIALSAFVRLLTEAFHLQMQRSRLAGGAAARFNFQKIEQGLRLVLSVVVCTLWLMSFTANLSVFQPIFRFLEYVLTMPHHLGSITFNVANIVLFFAIIYLAVLLQRYVGYFFGETDDEFNTDPDRKGSWLVAIRLVVLAVGFLLATMASGLPLDKITIVVGALGVGVGLGLQNIINNLVSGIILIFERPFQVGDFIEVTGKTGRVKDIGIRASKLISLSGSEIIVPNGDLLSGHVINWTLSNNHIRVELGLKLNLDTDLDKAKQLIRDEVLENPNTLHKLAPEILLSGVNGQVYDLKVLFWINNIRQEQVLKSEVLAGIHRRFTQEGINMI
ncbi:mechanosensitive ion channel [Hymenobacter sp. BT186]|uniref:Mechanosensitive ion channel n=1 Tax=Hymenobacter telluris TaxID=2816474 RepID=A0A939EV66_9BACT|nr:mechanosensitive ion channel domain-containing protein [Hymenobacter telluris]MBO0358038.1 mechanosensitive ion channel [Hymenobacter telluris]MBW3374065.1 mechanosensitive ion channel [Hymenobacter norwichensis]